MTAGERLVTLAGTGGVAGTLLLLMGSGATAGEALVDYSKLSTGTAETHLLVDSIRTNRGGGWERFSELKPIRARLKQKKIPEAVIDIIAGVVAAEPPNPVTTFRKNLKQLEDQKLEVEAIKEYVAILKKEIALVAKLRLEEEIAREDELIMMLMLY